MMYRRVFTRQDSPPQGGGVREWNRISERLGSKESHDERIADINIYIYIVKTNPHFIIRIRLYDFLFYIFLRSILTR